MDCTKIGSLICRLRKEKRLTQQQLANMLHVSDKAVSKWERGGGCPNPDVLTPLSNILGVGLEELLNGELGDERKSPENMKKLKFYVCPDCGNGAEGQRRRKTERRAHRKRILHKLRPRDEQKQLYKLRCASDRRHRNYEKAVS